MKKAMAFLLMACVCVSAAACRNTAATETTATETVETTTEEAVTESETETKAETEAAETTSETASSDEAADAQTASTLVVYFSCTGNTKAIAEYIADGLQADVYEIVAEDPYTDADLDYGDDSSRSTIEMNDPTVRPAIIGSVENMEQYDTVYIGYPIWWGEAPRIVDTFVESYDFTDKTVIPFATSISTGMGSSGSRLAELAGSGNWLEGQRFSESESAETVMEWVNSL